MKGRFVRIRKVHSDGCREPFIAVKPAQTQHSREVGARKDLFASQLN